MSHEISLKSESLLKKSRTDENSGLPFMPAILTSQICLRNLTDLSASELKSEREKVECCCTRLINGVSTFNCLSRV